LVIHELRDHVLPGWFKILANQGLGGDQKAAAPPAMQLKKPWSPRLVVCLASLIQGMPVASLRGQEYAPVVDGRYETSLEQPVGLAEDENDPKGGWDLGAVIS
jgi:hypothetical protein